MARKSPRTSRSVWEDQTTEYNPDAPAVQSAIRSERLKRRALLWIAWVVVPLCLLVSLGLAASNTSNQKPTDLSKASTAANASPGKAAAFAAVQQWLAGDPSPLPGGALISWNGFTVEDPPPADPDSAAPAPTYRFESHVFTLARGVQMFTATVQVAVDGPASAMATSSPALSPVLNAQLTDTVVPWFGVKTTTATVPVQDAVKSWATAYASGDPNALRRAVQDKDVDHTYVPLSDVASVADVRITSAADVPTDDKTKKPTQMIVRVELSLWWNGSQPPADAVENRKPAPITYDLLIDDADTASPFVVAWGPAGTGTTLKAQANALTGVDLQQLKAPTTTVPAPTSAEGEEGEGE